MVVFNFRIMNINIIKLKKIICKRRVDKMDVLKNSKKFLNYLA